MRCCSRCSFVKVLRREGTDAMGVLYCRTEVWQVSGVPLPCDVLLGGVRAGTTFPWWQTSTLRPPLLSRWPTASTRSASTLGTLVSPCTLQLSGCWTMSLCFELQAWQEWNELRGRKEVSGRKGAERRKHQERRQQRRSLRKESSARHARRWRTAWTIPASAQGSSVSAGGLPSS